MSGFLKIREASQKNGALVPNEPEAIIYMDAGSVRIVRPFLDGTMMYHDASGIGKHVFIAKAPVAIVMDVLRARSMLDDAKQPIIVSCGCDDDDDVRDPSENEL